MEKLKSFFRFTSRERLAILLLCLLMVLFWTLPLFFPEKPLKLTIAKSYESRSNSNGDSSYLNNAPNLNKSVSNSSRYSTELPRRGAHYFPFNPNAISRQQWQELGLSDRTILTIQHYLEKGGRFKKPEDIRKIWGLKPAEADRLVPYVQIPASFTEGKKFEFNWKTSNQAITKADSLSKQRTADFPVSPSVVSVPTGSAPVYQRKNWNFQPIDINEADTEQWMAFPGIGEVLAVRIVKFRDKIGGFTSIDQVGKTYGIKDSLFQLMKPLLLLEKARAKKD
jgi:DNA uptake protein ComE-like DNA-binding protein